jgi:hypothetical protein
MSELEHTEVPCLVINSMDQFCSQILPWRKNLHTDLETGLSSFWVMPELGGAKLVNVTNSSFHNCLVSKFLTELSSSSADDTATGLLLGTKPSWFID